MDDKELRMWAVEQAHKNSAYTGDASAGAIIKEAEQLLGFVTGTSDPSA